jgi:hypothetical protein
MKILKILTLSTLPLVLLTSSVHAGVAPGVVCYIWAKHPASTATDPIDSEGLVVDEPVIPVGEVTSTDKVTYKIVYTHDKDLPCGLERELAHFQHPNAPAESTTTTGRTKKTVVYGKGTKSHSDGVGMSDFYTVWGGITNTMNPKGYYAQNDDFCVCN